MSNDLWSVPTIASLLVALTSSIALGVNLRRWRRTQISELLLRHHDRFCAPDMRRARQLAAQKLREEEHPNYELEDVLDHFNIIGGLIEQKGLPPKTLHSLFGWWTLRWWHCAKDYIDERREDPRDRDPNMWSPLEKLVREIEAYRKKEDLPELSERAYDLFLEEESERSPLASP